MITKKNIGDHDSLRCAHWSSPSPFTSSLSSLSAASVNCYDNNSTSFCTFFCSAIKLEEISVLLWADEFVDPACTIKMTHTSANYLKC